MDFVCFFFKCFFLSLFVYKMKQWKSNFCFIRQSWWLIYHPFFPIKIHTLIVDNVVEFAMLAIVNWIPMQPKHQIQYSVILYDSIESLIQFSKLNWNEKKWKITFLNDKEKQTSIKSFKSFPFTSFNLADKTKHAPAHNLRFCFVINNLRINFSK